MPFITLVLITYIKWYFPYQSLHPDMLKTASKMRSFITLLAFSPFTILPLFFADWIHLQAFHTIKFSRWTGCLFPPPPWWCVPRMWTASLAAVLSSQPSVVCFFPSSWACQPILLACLYLPLKTGLLLQCWSQLPGSVKECRNSHSIQLTPSWGDQGGRGSFSQALTGWGNRKEFWGKGNWWLWQQK